jgi:transcriptional regulator with XRE-family HTH domain
VVAILRKIRKGKGMTLDQVGERSGLLPEAVSRAEREGVDARFSTVVAIARALDTPLCELIEKQGSHGKHGRQRRKA